MKDKQLDQILVRLKKEFNPVKAYLFGSQANGTATEESDYDLLLVVKESHLSRVAKPIRASEVIRDLNVSADVFIYTEDEFKEWVNEFSSIPETAVNTGVELKVG